MVRAFDWYVARAYTMTGRGDIGLRHLDGVLPRHLDGSPRHLDGSPRHLDGKQNGHFC